MTISSQPRSSPAVQVYQRRAAQEPELRNLLAVFSDNMGGKKEFIKRQLQRVLVIYCSTVPSPCAVKRAISLKRKLRAYVPHVLQTLPGAFPAHVATSTVEWKSATKVFKRNARIDIPSRFPDSRCRAEPAVCNCNASRNFPSNPSVA